MRKWRKKKQSDFNKKISNQWYDLYEDWELIDASFTAQYGIRLRNEPDMSWDEFCTLLSGIMPKTPLGQIVSIRSEEDEDMLKNFTKEQHKIRDDWRKRQIEEMTVEEKEEQINEIYELFKQAFG
ncbi:Gp15 family bacteriophage protein [Clostridium baratii]|uniref:Gp15 family bacteriophage protein n=1 Tax=Clostridium baratii TaxID=1561 RepID=UPI0030D08DCB